MRQVEKKETQMKKLFATMSLAAAVAAVIVSPALAQNGTHRHARDAYAASNPFAAYGSYRAQRPSARGSYSVYDTRGQYVGSDPDPTIRSKLAHDPGQGSD